MATAITKPEWDLDGSDLPLTHLDLSGNRLGGNGTCILLDALSGEDSKCKDSLRHLDLSGNVTAPEDGPAIAMGMAAAIMGTSTTGRSTRSKRRRRRRSSIVRHIAATADDTDRGLTALEVLALQQNNMVSRNTRTDVLISKDETAYVL